MKPAVAACVLVLGLLLPACSPRSQDNLRASVAVLRAANSSPEVDFVDPAGRSDWTAFDFFDDTRIYLPATINGRAIDVLLDSGAGLTTVDKAYAAEIGLSPIGAATVHGSGGDAEAQVATGVTIETSGVRLKNLTVLILDLKPVSDRIGHPTPVILGREAFLSLIVDLDIPGRRLAFHDPKQWRPPNDAVRLSLTRADGARRQTPISIEGRPAVLAIFDLGGASPVVMPESYAQQAGVLDGRPRSQRLLGGVGGFRPQAISTLRTLEFGGVVLHDVPVSIGAADAPEAARGFVVGMPVLRRFRMMTDYRRDALYLIGDAQALSLPFEKDRSGLRLEPAPGGARVLYVSPGSPADAAGWKAGDMIVAVDGKPTSTAAAPGPMARWGADAAGRTMALTMADGSVRRLTLKDYY